MKLKITQIILAAAFLGTAACTSEVNNDGDKVKVQELANFQGLWSSEKVKFVTDTCAFIFESTRTETDFTLKKFLLNCDSKGNVGLFAPMTFKLVSKEAADVNDVIAQAAPPSAQLIIRENAKLSSGWMDIANGNMLLNLKNDDLSLSNRLSFLASVRDGKLVISDVKMRQGYAVAEAVALVPNGFLEKTLSEKTAWDALKLPSQAIVSTEEANRNFLYCAGPRTYAPSQLTVTLVHYKGTRYSLSPNRTIGEVGTVAIDRPNYVYMARTDYGFVDKYHGYEKYSLSQTLVGGRPSGMMFEIAGNHALAFAGGDTLMCTFIQNDVFASYGGWRP